MAGMVFHLKPSDGRRSLISSRFGGRLQTPRITLALAVSFIACLSQANAQVSYVARFTLDKPVYLAGEPVFCTFTIRNTGTRPFAFSYRSPWRALVPNLPKEPRFRVTDARGRRVRDPAPKPCGGAREGVVYGFANLPPGGTHSERWLLNQWGALRAPGRYAVRAERRLPLAGFNSATEQMTTEPLAFALAINDLSFELKPATEDELRPLLDPYLKGLDDPKVNEFSESFLVATTLPQPTFLDRLTKLARPEAGGPLAGAWDPSRALEGLARLGTAPAWAAILKIAQGSESERKGIKQDTHDVTLSGYAILLLGEKADPAFLDPLIAMLHAAPDEIRGDILRALGFFHSTRANQVLFERLHSPDPQDRVNAILGLRNLETKNAVPALMAMVTDPNAEVRQVANFALLGLTGVRIPLAATASKDDAERASAQWHAWWREHNASFTPSPAAPCRDW